MDTTKTKIVDSFFRSEKNSLAWFDLFFNVFKNEWKIASDKLLSQKVELRTVLGSLWVFKNVDYYKYFITLLKSFVFYA